MGKPSSPIEMLRAILRKIPLFGDLADCHVSDHSKAAKEFAVITLFATTTFWFSALILLGLDANKDLHYLHMLGTTVRSGELFIFSVAFLGPVLWTALEDPVGTRPFPGKLWHTLAVLILGLVCAAFFALIKVASIPGSFRLNAEFLFSLSLWTAGFCLLLRYLALVYRKATLRPDEAMKRGEEAFASQFVQHQSEDAE